MAKQFKWGLSKELQEERRKAYAEIKRKKEEQEKRYNVMVKVFDHSSDKYKWLAVRPTNGAPYEWTKQEAEKYIETYGRGYKTLELKEV